MNEEIKIPEVEIPEKGLYEIAADVISGGDEELRWALTI